MRGFLLGLFLVVIVGGIFVGANTLFIVTEKQKALVMQLGKINRIIEDPGLYVKNPLFENVRWIEKRIQFIENKRESVEMADQKRYRVDAITILRIVDPQKFREAARADERFAKQQIQSQLNSAITAVYGRYPSSAALSKERAVMMRDIRDALRPEAEKLGIEIIDVRIRQTDLAPDVQSAAFERMKAEREAEAARRRAIGQAEKLRIESDAERQVKEIKANAQREAEIIRGKGEAKRNKVFADAFSKDPEFFAFYRSMKAYEKVLRKNDTTFVLTPDSEFFRYLKSPSGNADKK